MSEYTPQPSGLQFLRVNLPDNVATFVAATVFPELEPSDEVIPSCVELDIYSAIDKFSAARPYLAIPVINGLMPIIGEVELSPIVRDNEIAMYSRLAPGWPKIDNVALNLGSHLLATPIDASPAPRRMPVASLFKQLRLFTADEAIRYSLPSSKTA